VLHYSTLPFKLHRPVINCIDSAGVKYLDAGAGYDSYQWNTGETTRKIEVKKQGVYSVSVPYGEGGFINSEKITVNDIANPCNNKLHITQPNKKK
jgi:hypothetical protein